MTQPILALDKPLLYSDHENNVAVRQFDSERIRVPRLQIARGHVKDPLLARSVPTERHGLEHPSRLIHLRCRLFRAPRSTYLSSRFRPRTLRTDSKLSSRLQRTRGILRESCFHPSVDTHCSHRY